MRRYDYSPMATAPKDGTPIIAVVGGVETAIAYDNLPHGQMWVYWDEEDGGMTASRVRQEPSGWRKLF